MSERYDDENLYSRAYEPQGGTSDYTALTNKPKINNVEVNGDKSGHDYGLADSADIPTKTSELTNDSGFITSSDVPTKTSELTNDSGFITSSDVPTKTSELTNDSGFITASDVPTKTSELTNDSGFITSASVPTKTSELTNDSGFITASDVPTKTSDLTNDSGFITASDLPSKSSITFSLNSGIVYLVNYVQQAILLNGTAHLLLHIFNNSNNFVYGTAVTLFTLPANARPSGVIRQAALFFNAGATTETTTTNLGWVRIDTNGDVMVMLGSNVTGYRGVCFDVTYEVAP